MDCRDYQQALAAQPDGDFDGGAAHAADCVECRTLRDEWRALDKRMAPALQVSVPPLVLPELPDVADDNVVPLQVSRPAANTWFFGIAAAVALAAWLGLRLVTPDLSDATLAEQVVAHLEHEPYSRVVTDVAVPERTLDSVVNREVAELRPGLGLVTYARSCVINGREVPHLVIQGERGPVTLLLMPDEPVDVAVPLEGTGINGIILPMGAGSIAIIGEREESLENMSNRVLESVLFTT